MCVRVCTRLSWCSHTHTHIQRMRKIEKEFVRFSFCFFFSLLSLVSSLSAFVLLKCRALPTRNDKRVYFSFGSSCWYSHRSKWKAATFTNRLSSNTTETKTMHLTMGLWYDDNLEPTMPKTVRMNNQCAIWEPRLKKFGNRQWFLWSHCSEHLAYKF